MQAAARLGVVFLLLASFHKHPTRVSKPNPQTSWVVKTERRTTGLQSICTFTIQRQLDRQVNSATPWCWWWWCGGGEGVSSYRLKFTCIEIYHRLQLGKSFISRTVNSFGHGPRVTNKARWCTVTLCPPTTVEAGTYMHSFGFGWQAPYHFR